jgi:hypothetical protein
LAGAFWPVKLSRAYGGQTKSRGAALSVKGRHGRRRAVCTTPRQRLGTRLRQRREIVKKEDYIIPDETWLTGEFSHIPFGIMRPSEIEVILAFFLIYHNGNDIEAGEGELALKYRITESKARRFKIEFAQRYGKHSGIAGIIARSFENGEAPFELSENEKDVYFMIQDPYELKLIKEDLTARRIVHQGDFNGKLIKLSVISFIGFMSFYYDDVKKLMKKQINEELDRKAEANRMYWESLRIDKKLEKYGQKAIEGIVSLIGIGGSVMGALK